MAIRPDYQVGTLNLEADSADFTTTGSALEVAAVQAGDSIITPSGHILIIASITGQNSGTLFLPCPPDAAGTGLPLRIRFQPDGSRYQGAVRNLINLLSSGNLEAFAALVGSAGLVPIFTGVDTMDLADPATFGIQDPNGNLGELAALAGVDNLAELSGWTYDQITGAATAVSYGPQTLTSPQKTQARANIGAFSSSGGTISGDTTVEGSLIAGGANVDVIRIGPEAGNNIVIQADASIRVNNGAPSMTWPISIGGNASNADRVHGNQIRSASAVVMTNASGDATITYPAFPNGAICVVASHGDLSGINIDTQSIGVPNGAFNVKVTRTTDGSPVAVGNVRINYMVIGS